MKKEKQNANYLYLNSTLVLPAEVWVGLLVGFLPPATFDPVRTEQKFMVKQKSLLKHKVHAAKHCIVISLCYNL